MKKCLRLDFTNYLGTSRLKVESWFLIKKCVYKQLHILSFINKNRNLLTFSFLFHRNAPFRHFVAIREVKKNLKAFICSIIENNSSDAVFCMHYL